MQVIKRTVEKFRKMSPNKLVLGLQCLFLTREQLVLFLLFSLDGNSFGIY